jgi:hypothetical protein
MLISTGLRFGDGELAVRTVRNHRLTGLKPKRFAIELHRDHIGL